MKTVLTSLLVGMTIFSCNSIKKASTINSNNDHKVFISANIPADTLTYICDSSFNQKLFLKLDTIKNAEDNSYSLGQFGKCNPQNSVGFKVGQWIEYYETGNIKSQGSYGFGIIRNCCAMGYCYGQYSYKYGKWIYYYEDNKIKAILLLI